MKSTITMLFVLATRSSIGKPQIFTFLLSYIDFSCTSELFATAFLLFMFVKVASILLIVIHSDTCM